MKVARPSREQGEQTLFETDTSAYAGVRARSRWDRGIWVRIPLVPHCDGSGDWLGLLVVEPVASNLTLGGPLT
jgi:hypothetical protein